MASSWAKQGVDPTPCFAQELANATPSLDELRNMVVQTRVFAGTTHRVMSSPVIEILERANGFYRSKRDDLPTVFDVAILDEAGQITEPMSLGAINRASRFILVGDHQQLPPVVVHELSTSASLENTQQPIGENAVEPFDAILYKKAGVRGMDLSLFERLIAELPHTRLIEQYRMNAALMDFSSDHFYEREMRAWSSVADMKLPVQREALDALPKPFDQILAPENPLILLDVQGKEQGRRNRDEADVVVQILAHLLEPGLLAERWGARPFDPEKSASSIGIISPFRAQVQLLRALIREHFPLHCDHIEVDTVERFQGREKEIMLVSFVAVERVSTFLADHRRLNVTLTRARTKMIVAGHFDSLSKTSQLFRSLYESPQATVITIPGSS